jgi:outer membrane protein OmpA-like peptidoglycan-associated protein
MQNNQSSYSFWTWIVALVLALILLFMLLTGRGPSAACCSAGLDGGMPAVATDTGTGADTSAADVTPIAPAAEGFSFSASGSEFTSSGDGASMPWLSNADALKGILASGGEEMRVQGDGKNVTLSGIVDTDATKQQKGADVQAFFGADTTVDNQLMVKAAAEPAAVMAPPPAAKVFFDSGKTVLPADADATLAPIIDWLKANANSKAVLSGFHDPRGSKARNETLAKNRASAVAAALKLAGIDEARIETRMPESLEGSGDLAEARRVEVSVE